MKMSEMRELSKADLSAKIKVLSEESFRLKFQHGIRPLENTASMRKIRKQIARLKTAATECKS